MTADFPRPTRPNIGNGLRWSALGFATEPATPAPTPPTVGEMYAKIRDLIDRMPPPPETIKLTQQQIDELPKAPPRKPWEPDLAFFGIPVLLVDTVEESTPYQLSHPPAAGFREPPRPGWLARAVAWVLR